MNDAEREARTNTAALYRLVALEGWDDLVGTHISARIPGERPLFLLNPYGMLFEETVQYSHSLAWLCWIYYSQRSTYESP